MATNIMENDVELNDFEIGDRVQFVEGTPERKSYPNGGTVTEKGRRYLYVDLTGHGTPGGWYPWRFEKIVDVDQTFNYKVALRKVFDNPSIKLERKLKGEFVWVSCTGMNSHSVFIELNDDYEYRIKPEEKKPIKESHFLVKSKGKFFVTSKKHSDEDAVRAAYKSAIVVIQRLGD